MNHLRVSRIGYFGVLFFALFLAGCALDEDLVNSCEAIRDSTPLTEREALFFELALNEGTEEDVPRLRKWNGNINLFVEGNPSEELLNELSLIVSELNSLGTFIEITLVDTVESSNLRFFFGTKEDYVALVEPDALISNEGINGIVTIARNSTFEIEKASICIDNINFPEFEFQQHAMRKVMAQSLGLVNETTSYDDSIFHETIVTNRSYSELDEDMIAFMLGGVLRPGFCPNTVLRAIE